MAEQNPPIEVLRDGNLKASIWRNESDNGSFFTTTISRIYKDDRGNYHDTNGFSGADLLRVAELAREAYRISNDLRLEQRQDMDRNQGNGRSASGVFDRQSRQSRPRTRSPR